MKIKILAIKRSGMHAIVNWICKQLLGSTIHFNNATKEDSKFVTLYENGEEIETIKNYYKNGTPLYRWPWLYLEPRSVDNIVYNQEDINPIEYKLTVEGVPDYELLIF